MNFSLDIMCHTCPNPALGPCRHCVLSLGLLLNSKCLPYPFFRESLFLCFFPATSEHLRGLGRSKTNAPLDSRYRSAACGTCADLQNAVFQLLRGEGKGSCSWSCVILISGIARVCYLFQNGMLTSSCSQEKIIYSMHEVTSHELIVSFKK